MSIEVHGEAEAPESLPKKIWRYIVGMVTIVIVVGGVFLWAWSETHPVAVTSLEDRVKKLEKDVAELKKNSIKQ